MPTQRKKIDASALASGPRHDPETYGALCHDLRVNLVAPAHGPYHDLRVNLVAPAHGPYRYAGVIVLVPNNWAWVRCTLVCEREYFVEAGDQGVVEYVVVGYGCRVDVDA
jgi:hypothetical protein